MENNFIFSLFNKLHLRYLIGCLVKRSCIVLLSSIIFYYNFFIDLKNYMVLNFESLTDFTGLHYPEILNEIELNYFLLSYKLSLRCIFKLFIKKEDLIISLNKLFKSSSWLEREI